MPTASSTAPSLADWQALQAENAALRAQQLATAELHALADAYRQSQVRFRTVFEQSPLGHKIIDATLTIRQANPAVAAMLGLARPDDLVGRTLLEFAHPDHRNDWRYLQDRLWTHKLPSFTLETCLVRPNGSLFWCRVTSVLFLDQDQELGYTTLEDIDDHKSLEIWHKRLYDAQETVLHLVAHDVKTPVAHIQLLVELLRREPGPAAAASSATGQYLALIQRACEDVCVLLQDLLYLGELDAAHLKKERTDLGALLENQLVVHRLAAQEKGIAFTVELPPVPVQANLNRVRFSRVVDNVVSNALKFTPAGGQVWVRVQERAGRARLVVQDTGVGIAADLQATVFDKFTPAKRASLHDGTTTGLGLFITQQIVRLHGGSIWLESRVGAGTTFFIELV